MKALTGNELGAHLALRDDRLAPDAGRRRGARTRARLLAQPRGPRDRRRNGQGHGSAPFPVTHDRQFAGVVKPVSDGVTGVSAGDELFGSVPAM
jgi:hypothetical protein